VRMMIITKQAILYFHQQVVILRKNFYIMKYIVSQLEHMRLVFMMQVETAFVVKMEKGIMNYLLIINQQYQVIILVS